MNYQKQKTFNNKLQLFNNTFESLKRFNSSTKKNIYKSSITSNNSNSISNKTILNKFDINSPASRQNSNKLFLTSYQDRKKLINKPIKKSENNKAESIDDDENLDIKLIKSYTKGTDNNYKLNKFILDDINSRNNNDRTRTFQLINKNFVKTQNKSPYKVFKTNLNDSKINRKIFIYEDDGFNTQRKDLLIPEEDKIFDEFKKYDYFTRRYNKKYKIQTINNNEDKKEIKTNNSIKLSKSKTPNKNKINFTKTYYDSKGRFVPSQLDRELFDCLYKTSDDFHSQLDLIKKTKKSKKLKDYQTELLDTAKNVISIYNYDKLKKEFDVIQKWNKYKKKLNLNFIKKLEIDEKVIIDDVNKCNAEYLKSKTSRGNKKYKFKLPILEFKSVIKIKNKKWMEFMMNRNNETKKLSRLNTSEISKKKTLTKDDTK